MGYTVERYTAQDIPGMMQVWNEVVDEGLAFPQLDDLTEATAAAFFAAQDHVGIIKDGDTVLGLYILHPNNVGRCGHQANASYAVLSSALGKKIGEALVLDSLAQAKALGYRLMIFNAVVSNNARAMRLYPRLGFVHVGTIPGGFLLKDGTWEDINVFYYTLD